MLGDIPSFLYGEAVNNAIYILSMCPMKAIKGNTSYKAWTRKKPNISHFRIFGCDAYAFVDLEKRKKLDKRYEKCIFMGYDNQHQAISTFL